MKKILAAICHCSFSLLVMSIATGLTAGADRETQVREDRKQFEGNDRWIYNDLPKAFEEARRLDRPLLVVFRCIPCEACSTFDEQVVARDHRIRKLIDRFVCVRVPQGNGLDLNRFQFDYDMSLAMFLMRADGTIYGRFGTRSGRTDQDHEMSIEGFGKALSRALKMHDDFGDYQPFLVGKAGLPVAIMKPEEHAWLKGKYTDRLDYEGKVAKSCIHCHQIREAQRLTLRNAGEPIPDDLMFPWPSPTLLGLRLDPDECATVKEVADESLAAKAGFQAGDDIQSVNGQHPLSIADIQWVLHSLKEGSELKMEVVRKGNRIPLEIRLRKGWRQLSDISWRVTTWDLRRIALGGMVLEPAAEDWREKMGVPSNKLALRVKYVGQYGEHAKAKETGFEKDDVVVDFDNDDSIRSESSLIAKTVNAHRPGSKVPVTVMRSGNRLTFHLPIQ